MLKKISRFPGVEKSREFENPSGHYPLAYENTNYNESKNSPYNLPVHSEKFCGYYMTFNRVVMRCSCF